MSSEKKALIRAITLWNESRLDLFEISQPDKVSLYSVLPVPYFVHSLNCFFVSWLMTVKLKESIIYTII